MRVLYVDQTGKLGGGEIALLPWLCSTAGKDMAVVLFEDGPFRNLLEEAGVTVEVIVQDKLKSVRRESGYRALFTAIPALLSLKKRLSKTARNFDVLYANSQKAFLLTTLCKQKNQCLVWHLRDILTADHFSGILRRIAVFAGNRFASVIIANSQATADSFVASGGNPEKIRVVHDGVSAGPFDAIDPAEIATVRRELLGAGNEQLIGVFGRLSPWKGQHIFLEALSSVTGVKGVLVGDALFGEDVYADSLRRRASQPDLAGRVVFLGFRRDVASLMKAMDVVVHTSTSPEPFGLVIVEGMLASKPVIATRAGGAIEIIEDGKSGLLVLPGSVPELQAALRRVLSDPAFAQRLSTSGRQRAERDFSLDTLFNALRASLEACRK